MNGVGWSAGRTGGAFVKQCIHVGIAHAARTLVVCRKNSDLL
jgi:hypothetical protein